jgi:hypothetical protein
MLEERISLLNKINKMTKKKQSTTLSSHVQNLIEKS